MKKTSVHTSNNNNNHNNHNSNKNGNGKPFSQHDNEFAARFQANEQFFSSFMDLIPPKVYLNQDDYSNWTKMATGQSKKRKQTNEAGQVKKSKQTENGKHTGQDIHLDAEEEEEEEEEEEGGEEEENENDEYENEGPSKHRKFDPRLFKTVSQILKDLERFEEANKNESKKKPTFQKPIVSGKEKNTSIKVFNKSQHKSLSKLANVNQASVEVDKSEPNSDDTTNNKSDEKTTHKESNNKRVSKFKEKKNAALKHKRQRYDSQNEAQIVKMEHSGKELTSDSVKERKPILNKNGQVVFSKFDFTADKTIHLKKNKDDKITTTNAKPKDYKKLLKKLQEKREKVEELKQNAPEKANELELKDKWRSAIDKASGLKVKDDVSILKKAVKRLEKKKSKSKKNWQDRTKEVERKKEKFQDKRRKNIEKRREKNKETKIKKLKKKGRILPGF